MSLEDNQHSKFEIMIILGHYVIFASSFGQNYEQKSRQKVEAVSKNSKGEEC